MKYLLILLALVALPIHAEKLSVQQDDCNEAMWSEFPYPEWRVTYDTLVGCMNPAICGSLFTSFAYDAKVRPAGKRLYVWCRWSEGEVSLSETNPYKVDEEERFSVPD